MFVLQEVVQNEDNNNNNNNTKTFNKCLGNVVNVIVSFDMGWSKRGNGRSYDSLNGYDAIIGFFTGKILDYRTRNRKCRKCDLGHSVSDHDCRKNYHGSAKAMEADVGEELINRSNILKRKNLNVKVVIGDEDSTTMAAVNNANLKNNVSKKVYKLADMNHCKQNAVNLASAVRSIPDHLINRHQNCGAWCRTKNKKKSGVSTQKFVITDERLHSELQTIFNVYADNASKYCVPASSQANESLNSIISHQLPKNKSYSTTNSADFRVASAIAVKNEGNSYLADVRTRLGLPKGEHCEKYCKELDNTRAKQSVKSKTYEFKKRRLELTENRVNLRKKLESQEGITYEKNIAFENNSQLMCLSPLSENSALAVENCQIIFFDLETSGRRKTSDILQIAAKVDDKTFSVFIQPTQPIDEEASKVNGFENVGNVLYLKGNECITISMIDALLAFYEFFSKNSKGCILTAHNASFDVSFLIREIQKYSLAQEFQKIIYGFCDSLHLFRKKFPSRKGTGMFTLSKLAEDFLTNGVSPENFHEALYDVIILDQLVKSLLKPDDLFLHATDYVSSVNKSILDKQVALRSKTFHPLKGKVTDYLIKKLASSGLTFEDLLEKYKDSGEEGITLLLTDRQNNKKPLVGNKKNTLPKLIDGIKSAISQKD
ncbi:uncharacterized protein LOC127279510 [Leptopilina boulardi]|uniref:uncharacterized protein LOC127279510 n=1 Tax=Leptopilina boulardi TaxID=63433 RepID=UPI0021F5B353|nr:uncharacterized protein LOC127279510 [Leptopilina boulardi]